MSKNMLVRVTIVFLFLLVAALSPFPLWGGEPGSRLDSILQEITSTQHNINDLTAEVSQVRSSPLMNAPSASKGTMYFKRPDRIRLDMLPPNQSMTVLSEGVLWIYFADDKVAQRYRVQEHPHLTKWLLVFQNPIATLGQRVALGPETETTVTLVLDPAEDLILFEDISLVFDKSTWMLRSLELKEKSGDHTIITYHYTTINAGIQDSLFQLQLPPDVDVIEPLKQ